MGKGKRAAFSNYRPPLSSADLISSTAPLIDCKPSLYKPASPGKPALTSNEEHILEGAPIGVLITTYISYFIVICFGHVRDFFAFRFRPQAYKHLVEQDGYAPITSGFDTFYQRRLFARIRDAWDYPITGCPGRTVTLLEREGVEADNLYTLTGKKMEVLNLSSYNYLGFSQKEGLCTDAVESAIRKHGLSSCSPRADCGTTELHVETEALVARFLGLEASLIVSMGFATNSTTIPSLVGKGCLVISDALNHCSLIEGVRLSGASIRVFKHNDLQDLETILRDSTVQGQPRTHRPWRKILIIIEGLYSMEGTFCNLPGIIELKKKYKAYLYMDEAHSIGAVGPNGRGVCDFYGVDPQEIDIMMGTFTKSFGASGGYIAGRKSVIDRLRLSNHSNIYAESITAPVLVQIQTSMRIIMGEIGGDEGRRRVQSLARNSLNLSQGLKKMGFILYGDEGSPVIPLLLFHPAKIAAFAREMRSRGVAVVVVGYPATPIISSRVRLCVSASHTPEDIENVLSIISEVGDRMCLKMSRINRSAST